MDSELMHKKSLEYASDMAGEYLNELNKSDLAAMDKDEWIELLNVITKNYIYKKNELTPCPF